MNSWQTTTTIWLVTVAAIAGAMTGTVAWSAGVFDGQDQAALASQEMPEEHGHAAVVAIETGGAAHEADATHEAQETDAAHEDEVNAAHEAHETDAAHEQEADAAHEAHETDSAHEAQETDAAHEKDATSEHGHSAGMVDPDAPEVELEAVEFAYNTSSFEIEAGRPVTIALHNQGVLEHDITIEGFEHLGGAHAQPGEEAAFTVTIEQPGEYRYYCTIPGHLEAGMEGVLVVR